MRKYPFALHMREEPPHCAATPDTAPVEALPAVLLPYIRVDKGEKVEHSLDLRYPFRLGSGYPVQTRIILLLMPLEGELCVLRVNFSQDTP